MAPLRKRSDPRVPVPVSQAREILAEEGYKPNEDETPTSPMLEQPLCTRCEGEGVVVIERTDGTYYGPVKCPRCFGSRVDPMA